jgi:hypothetical protein
MRPTRALPGSSWSCVPLTAPCGKNLGSRTRSTARALSSRCRVRDPGEKAPTTRCGAHLRNRTQPDHQKGPHYLQFAIGDAADPVVSNRISQHSLRSAPKSLMQINIEPCFASLLFVVCSEAGRQLLRKTCPHVALCLKVVNNSESGPVLMSAIGNSGHFGSAFGHCRSGFGVLSWLAAIVEPSWAVAAVLWCDWRAFSGSGRWRLARTHPWRRSGLAT